jgi:hypothetical protein
VGLCLYLLSEVLYYLAAKQRIKPTPKRERYRFTLDSFETVEISESQNKNQTLLNY